VKFKIFALLIGLFSLAGCAGARIAEENKEEKTFSIQYEKTNWMAGETEKNSRAIAMQKAKDRCDGHDFDIVKERIVQVPISGILFSSAADVNEVTFRCKNN